MNVTEVPAHIVPDGDATMLTAGTGTGLIVIVIKFDVAVTELVQDAFDVITQVTKSLFARLPFT